MTPITQNGFGPAFRLYALPPDSVRIDGAQYALNTGHRTSLRALAALEDRRLTTLEQQGILLHLLYKTPPPNKRKGVQAAVWFLNAGRQMPEADGPRIYSLTQDGALIAAALQKSCGVDVWGPEMHWWKFCALLGEIGEDTLFARIVYLRQQRARGKLTADERRAAAALEPFINLEPAGSAAPVANGEVQFFTLLNANAKEGEISHEQNR